MTPNAVLEPKPLLHRSRGADAADEGPEPLVLQALEATGRLSLRNISAVVREGHVVLLGSVPSYYLKQVAQTACMAVEGVKSLENRIAVRQPSTAICVRLKS